MPEPLSFFIPVKGRFVSGDHDKIRTTDHHGKQEPDRAKHKTPSVSRSPKRNSDLGLPSNCGRTSQRSGQRTKTR